MSKLGTTFARMSLPPASASTFHTNSILLDKIAAVAEADFIARDAPIRDLRTIARPEIGNDYTDEEELEWDNLFAQSHVQAGLDRLAEEAERQFAMGETEEGGFAVE